MLEHQFAQEIHQQVRNGFPFDEAKAALLAAKLMTRRVDLSSELQALFEPTVVETKSPIGWSIEVEGKTYEALTKTALKTVLKDAGLKQSLATNAKRKGNKT